MLEIQEDTFNNNRFDEYFLEKTFTVKHNIYVYKVLNIFLLNIIYFFILGV